MRGGVHGWVLGVLLGVVMSSAAGQLPSPPPLADEPVEEQKFLQLVTHHHNNLVIVTSNPNGSRRGRPGDVIGATFGGANRLCMNTGSGPGTTTTWQCVSLATP